MLLHATAGQRIVVGMAPAGKEEPRKPMNGSSGLPLVTGYVFSCRLRSTAVSWLLQILVRQQICGWWSWGPGTGDFNDRIAVQHIKIVVITNSTVFEWMWIAVFILLYFLLPGHTHHYKTKEDKVYLNMSFLRQSGVWIILLSNYMAKHSVYYAMTCLTVLKEYKMP